MNVLSATYGRIARSRRSWYERHPQSRRVLDHPVISIGNLSVGGSGKTPITAALARLLVGMGEKPAILSRGYGRRRPVDGVVVASAGEGVLEGTERTGDEPQLLARTLKGVSVLVSPDRYLAGRLAERRLGCTVLLLDDGFQHLPLARTVDLVVMPASDLDEAILPAGPLREGLDAACSADALLVPGPDGDVTRVSAAFDRMPVFKVVNRYLPVRPCAAGEEAPTARLRVVAVAGIARPQRFFDALRGEGWEVDGELAYPDHHWYTERDIDRIRVVARQARADLVVTTEKDAVRLPSLPGWAVMPVEAVIEPADRFSAWLRDWL